MNTILVILVTIASVSCVVSLTISKRLRLKSSQLIVRFKGKNDEASEDENLEYWNDNIIVVEPLSDEPVTFTSLCTLIDSVIQDLEVDLDV